MPVWAVFSINVWLMVAFVCHLALSPVHITKSTSLAHACSSHAKVWSTNTSGVSHSLRQIMNQLLISIHMRRYQPTRPPFPEAELSQDRHKACCDGMLLQRWNLPCRMDLDGCL